MSVENQNTRSQLEQSLLDLLIEVNRSRATSAGLDPSQYDAVTATIHVPEQWLAAFRATAEEHIDRARRAEDEGRFVSAAFFKFSNDTAETAGRKQLDAFFGTRLQRMEAVLEGRG